MKRSQTSGYWVWGIGYGENESHAICTPQTPNPIPHTLNSKSGFGLIEVLAAAVVLAFLLVGLNLMQKGNRESILRVRARDAANVVAQDIIDSISALGSASVAMNPTTNGPWTCKRNSNGIPEGTPEEISLCRERTFTGSVSRQLKDTMRVTVPYSVTVDVRPENHLQDHAAGYDQNDRTAYIEAASGSGGSNLSARHQFAKQVDVTVNWKFKNSDQSINVSAVVR